MIVSGAMQEDRALILRHNPTLRDQLQRVAMNHRVTIEDVVQTVLGREVDTLYATGQLAGAVAALGDQLKEAVLTLRAKWPEPVRMAPREEPFVPPPPAAAPEASPSAEG